MSDTWLASGPLTPHSSPTVTKKKKEKKHTESSLHNGLLSSKNSLSGRRQRDLKIEKRKASWPFPVDPLPPSPFHFLFTFSHHPRTPTGETLTNLTPALQNAKSSHLTKPQHTPHCVHHHKPHVVFHPTASLFTLLPLSFENANHNRRAPSSAVTLNAPPRLLPPNLFESHRKTLPHRQTTKLRRKNRRRNQHVATPPSKLNQPSKQSSTSVLLLRRRTSISHSFLQFFYVCGGI